MLVALAVVLAAWLISPLFGACHLEGYTANLKAIAISANHGDAMGQDLVMPVLTEYLYYTRVGIVLLLRAIDTLCGESGDWGFRGLMIASFLLLAASCTVIAQRWNGVSLAAALGAIVLTPGIVELGFFFNDNVVSAAFAVGALSIVSRWNSVAAYVAGGGTLAFALACRTDGILLAPMLLGLAWLSNGLGLQWLRRVAGAACGGMAVTAGIFLGAHATPFQAIDIARHFVESSTVSTPELRILVALWFTGPPALVLCTIGIVARLHRAPRNFETMKWIAVFVLYPAMIAVLGMARLSSEVRYLYPLTAPALVLHAGFGLDRLAAWFSRPGKPRIAATAIAAVLCANMAVPPQALIVRDGPRALSGRLWSPLLWLRWQSAQRHSMRRVAELVASADAVPRTLVLATHFNDDFYVKLRLLEDGYQVRAPNTVFPDCAGGFSVYVKPGHVVIQIRTENQYNLAPIGFTQARALQIQFALQCHDIWTADKMYLTAVGSDIRWMASQPDPALFAVVRRRLSDPAELSASLIPDAATLTQPFDPLPATEATPVYLRIGEFHAFAISQVDLAAIENAARRIFPETDYGYAAFIAYFRAVIHPAGSR